jgi:hypothetical protein
MTGTVQRTDQSSANAPHRRPSANITPIERIGRMLIGAIGVGAGIVLLAAGGTALTIVFEVLLVAAGLDLVVTGALGHCPLYRKLGHVPTSLRRQA